ncbi:high affinity glucose transporter [Fusarium poae]
MPIGNIYVIAATSVVGGALFGFDISSISAQLGENSYKCYFNQGPKGPPFNDDLDCSGPTSLNQGGITASMAAGSWLGALCSGILSDRLGRKYSIMVGCIIWSIGSIISCASQNIGMLVVGRIINGFAVGIESAQVPVYIAEISPPSKRGRFIGMQQWAITWGILIMYYISYGSANIGGRTSADYSTAAFRVPWGLQMVPGIFLFFMMMLLPESPRWLARKDRWDECHAVLTLVHGHGDPDHPFVALELQDIKDMCAFEASIADVTYLDLFKPSMLNRTIIGVFTQIWSQLTGMNVMMYYISYVFSMAGYKGNANLLASSIQYIINGLIACTYLFVASYAPTWGPASWTYPPELFPLRLRGKGVAFATSSNWAFNTALGLFTPVAFENITWKSYIIFGVFNVAMFVHVFFMFPETAGKTLEETAHIFEDPNGIKFIGTPAWKTRVATHATTKAEKGDVEAKLSHATHEEVPKHSPSPVEK